jgi:ppGpp synthetase/RelA/SpoT-type nucleotidyltranferase
MKSTPPNLSNNQIDRLGERLKAGSPSDADVEMLSSYRNSFADAAKSVADTVRAISGLEVTARSLKTTLSIVAKLKREGVRQLSVMQDIGGCRVTVSNLTEQNLLTEKLMIAFPDAKFYDRVAKPSHGYRAKHLVAKVEGRRIEIQIRTTVQHQWAMLSEAFADALGQNLKYGVVDEDSLFQDKLQNMLSNLQDLATTIARSEQIGSIARMDDEKLQAALNGYKDLKNSMAEFKRDYWK